MGPEEEEATVIEVLENVLVAPESPEAVLDIMASPDVKIVTMTVTEKGYCHSPATGELDMDNVDIQHDINQLLPVSAPGYLVRALQRRKDAGVAPFTVLTCDNLPENGKMVRGVVIALAKAIDPALANWIADNGCFPSSMVDRITPATTEDDLKRVELLTQTYDAAPVLCEPFRQWVVEDTFVNGQRPDFAAAGVELVTDVTPYEHMKLRMLNGTHSSLAYIGYLAGHETIAQTVADPVLATFVKKLWANEIMPAVEAPPSVSLSGYADALFERYANPSIRHRTWQIAMDGSQKLPQRLLGTLSQNLSDNRETPGLYLAVAAWMRYVGGVDEKGDVIDVKDPLADRLKEISVVAKTPEQCVQSLLSVSEIFPESLAKALLEPVTDAYLTLVQYGAREAAARV